MTIQRTLFFLTALVISPISNLSGSSLSALTGHWSLDGNGSDLSGNNINLNVFTHVKGLMPSRFPWWVEGQMGSALNLPGIPNTGMTEPDTPAIALQTPSVTLSAWVFPRSELAHNYESEAWQKWEWIAAQGDNFGLFLTPVNQAAIFYIKDSEGDWSGVFTPDNSVRFDKWQHIAGSFDADSHSLRIYIDGKEVGGSQIDGSIEYSTGDGFTIGSMKNYRNFNGVIDDVKVFDSALSNNDIEQLSSISTPPYDDTQAPVITLNDDNPYVILVNEPFVDPGAKAVDNVDGEVDVVADIGGVNTAIIGTYTVIYTAKDKAMNLATKTRVVKIVPRSSGYSGLWQLDRVVNAITVDQSTHATNLRVNNDAELVQGKDGSALRFNGYNQDASTASATVLQTPSIHINAWVYPRSNPENYQWVWVAAQADNYGLYLTPDNKGINFYIKDVNGGWRVAASADNSFQYDQWQYISGSFDSDTGILRVRKNGLQIGSNYAEGIEYSTGDGFTIGSMQGERYFTGDIDQVVIFDHTPTHTEGTISATSTGRLNDTGVTKCGDDALGASGSAQHNNHLDCNAPDPDGDPIPPGQDAQHGRDTNPATNDDADGHAGFSFIKLGHNGKPLKDQTASTFSCVKDNVTGLIWEVKTENGLHGKNDIYSWYNSDDNANGGEKGKANYKGQSCFGYESNNPLSFCNTEAFVTKVNIAGWCGAFDWRMPTRKELESIVDYDVDGDASKPAIDEEYFPNTVIPDPASMSAFYRTSSPVARRPSSAWSVSFIDGAIGFSDKSFSLPVRLVRGK